MSFSLRRFGAAPAGLSVAALAVGLLVGCDKKEDVRAYQAPKETAAAPVVASANGAATSSARQWDVPEGWKEVPGSGTKDRAATFAVSKDEPEALVAVTHFRMSVPLLANINRWAGQIGMTPVAEADVPKVSRQVETKAGKADFVDLTGPEAGGKPAQRMLAAIFEHGGESWYFKLTGSKDVVESQKDKFESFVKSVHFADGQPGSQTAAAAPAGDLPAGHPPISADGPPTPGGCPRRHNLRFCRLGRSGRPDREMDDARRLGPGARRRRRVHSPDPLVQGAGGRRTRRRCGDIDRSQRPAGQHQPLARPGRPPPDPGRQRRQRRTGNRFRGTGPPVRLPGTEEPDSRRDGPARGPVVVLQDVRPGGPGRAQKDNFKNFVTSVQFAR